MRKSIIFLATAILLINFSCKNRSDNCSSLSGYEIVMAESPLDNTVSRQVEVRCPGNKYAFGAGWSVEDPTNAILEGQATHFQLSYDGKGYLVNAKNNSTFSPTWKLRVRCICADVCTSDTTTPSGVPSVDTQRKQ